MQRAIDVLYKRNAPPDLRYRAQELLLDSGVEGIWRGGESVEQFRAQGVEVDELALRVGDEDVGVPRERALVPYNAEFAARQMGPEAGEAGVPRQRHGGYYDVEVGPAYPRGHGVVEEGHNAQLRLVRNGETVMVWREVSGQQTAAQRAMGFPDGSLSSHTEPKALTRMFLGPDDVLVVTAQSAPCRRCRGAMNQTAAQTGATIQYQWREGGQSWVWEAGRGLVRRGGVIALPGKTVAW